MPDEVFSVDLVDRGSVDFQELEAEFDVYKSLCSEDCCAGKKTISKFSRNI